MSRTWADQLDLLIRARTPIVWIRSFEEQRVEALLQQAAQRLGSRTLLRWDFIAGLAGAPNREGEAARNPMAALAVLDGLPQDSGAILLLREGLRQVPNQYPGLEATVDLLEINDRGPRLAVRPYASTTHYGQVVFDTNRMIAEVLQRNGIPVPRTPVLAADRPQLG